MHDLTTGNLWPAMGPSAKGPTRDRVVQETEAQQRVTEIVNMPGCGHAPTIDRAWVAEKALEFVRRFTAGTRKVA
jgi:hypothetical protein